MTTVTRASRLLEELRFALGDHLAQSFQGQGQAAAAPRAAFLEGDQEVAERRQVSVVSRTGRPRQMQGRDALQKGGGAAFCRGAAVPGSSVWIYRPRRSNQTLMRRGQLTARSLNKARPRSKSSARAN